jgi:hypothetical protein
VCGDSGQRGSGELGIGVTKDDATYWPRSRDMIAAVVVVVLAVVGMMPYLAQSHRGPRTRELWAEQARVALRNCFDKRPCEMCVIPIAARAAAAVGEGAYTRCGDLFIPVRPNAGVLAVALPRYDEDEWTYVITQDGRVVEQRFDELAVGGER